MRTTPEVRQQLRESRLWPADTELLAQLVEEVSVLAADHRRKKPRQIRRPAFVTARPRKSYGEGIKHAIGVLRANATPRIAAANAMNT